MQFIYAEGAASFSSVLDYYACRSGTGVATGRGQRTPSECNAPGDRTIYQMQNLIFGNPDLKEEEGKSWVAGFVWDVTDGMSLTADWYRIRLQGAVRQLSNGFLLRQEADCRLGETVAGGAPPSDAVCQDVYQRITRIDAPGTPDDQRITRINSELINTALQDTSGIDATWRYRFTTDRAGSFDFNVAYSLVLTNKYQQTDDDDLEDYRDREPIYFYPERSRMRGSLTWRYDDWTTTLFGSRFGTAWSAAETDGVNRVGGAYGRRLAPYTLYNLSIGRKFGPNVEVMGQVVNLFDRQFRKDNSETGHPFFNP